MHSLFRDVKPMSTLHHTAEIKTERLGAAGPRQLGDGKTAVTRASVLSQIEACIPALRRYAVALLRSRDEADDLVHDCLVRALDVLPSRRDETDVRAWLFTSMHNLFISRMRRRRFRVRSEVLDETTHEAAHSQCPSEEDGLQWRDLLRGLERLPDEQRSVVLLVSVEDLSYPEAATVLGMPARMMMSLLAGGRERLRQFTNTDAGPALRRLKWAATPAV
jgi:RNA polymerase sigma-70 factor, ECF subfamily